MVLRGHEVCHTLHGFPLIRVHDDIFDRFGHVRVEQGFREYLGLGFRARVSVEDRGLEIYRVQGYG